MLIRRATSDELGPVASLLQTAGHQPLSAALPLSNIFVALQDGTVVGVIALEVTGLRGLVWPAAVDPSYSGSDAPTLLLQTLLARAHELSLRELYILTEKDGEFYTATGFAAISRETLPPEIYSTRAYRDQSESAQAMRLQLATRFV